MVIIRWLFFVLGGLALAAGVALSALWWKALSAPVAANATIPHEVVLVAARAIGPGTLLAPEDVRWKRMPALRVPAGSLLRGPVVEKALIGAALRRKFRAGEPLSSSALVKPGEPGFLPAALAPGMRAVSLALSAAEGDAGVLDPGDRVDVVLTQDFTGPRVRPTRRTLGEIVLQNRRVIAVGHRIVSSGAPKRPLSGFVREGATGVPQTVTLEVTSRQATELMVASRLGKLQLALLSAGEGGRARPSPAPRPKRAIWAVEVSPALRALQESEARQSPLNAAPGMAVSVVRGTRFEWRCFDGKGWALPSCSASALLSSQEGPAKPRPASAPAARTAGAAAPAS